MVILFLFFAINLVLAQNYYITNPIQGTVFKAGEKETILWNKLNDQELLDVKSVRIDLVDGDSNNARLVRLVAEVSSNVNVYDWNVPSDLVPKSDYFLRMSARSKSGQVVYNYSARFSILGGTGKEIPSSGSSSSNSQSDIDMMVIFSMIFCGLIN